MGNLTAGIAGNPVRAARAKCVDPMLQAVFDAAKAMDKETGQHSPCDEDHAWCLEERLDNAVANLTEQFRNSQLFKREPFAAE